MFLGPTSLCEMKLIIFNITLFAVSNAALILEPLPDAEIEYREIVESTKNIVDRFVFRTPIVFFKDEVVKLWWSSVLFKRLQKPKMILKKKNDFNIEGFYILFPSTYKTYRKIFDERTYDKSKFLLIWDKVNASMRTLKLIFEDFWTYQHINVVSLMHNKIYTFLPYTENQCSSVGEPVIVDYWDGRKGRFSLNRDIFSTHVKVRNLQKCPLKTIGNHQPPDNMMTFCGGSWSARGVGSVMLDIVSKHLNFTPIITSTNITQDLTWYYFYEELSTVAEMLYRKEADLAFGWFSYASVEIHNLDLTVELARVSSIDCFGWAVPYRAGQRPPNSAYYTYEFEVVTWVLVVLTVAVTAAIMYCVRKNVSSILAVYQILLEQPVTGHQGRTSFKFLFMNFAFYGLIIAGTYKASFGSFMSISLPGKDFVSVKEILDSSLKMGGSPEMLSLMNATSMEATVQVKLMEKFKILKPNGLEDIMSRLVKKRDIAVLGVKRSLYYHSIREAKRIKVKIPFRFIPGCLLRAHTTHFMFRRGSHLIEPVNDVVNRLFETGVIPFSIVHLGSNKISPVERFKGRTIHLAFLKAPFLVLIAGYLMSSVVLLVEILYRKYLSDVCG